MREHRLRLAIVALLLAAAVPTSILLARHPRGGGAASAVARRPPPRLTTPTAAPADETEATPPLPQSAETLDAYLATLEARAQRDPYLASLDIESGVEAIHRFTEALGARRAAELDHAFIRRMTELASEADSDVTPQEIDVLIERYQAASDARTRDRIQRRYLAAVSKLGPVDRLAELHRAQRFIGQ
jgi:hypothetical protein